MNEEERQVAKARIVGKTSEPLTKRELEIVRSWLSEKVGRDVGPVDVPGSD